MRTLEEIASTYETDKTQSMGYIENYEDYFGRLRDKPVRLLEIGVLQGGSLLTWREYFPEGLTVGLDLSPCPFEDMPDRVKFYQGSQDDTALLERIATECAPDGFDIIIDDAAHIGSLSRASFHALFERHLKPGGIYVVEDWGTGYWESWPDGAAYPAGPAQQPDNRAKATFMERVAARLFGKPPVPASVDPNFSQHNFGMVGFVKELVDEVGWLDIVHPERGNRSLASHSPLIRSMHVFAGQVFLRKSER